MKKRSAAPQSSSGLWIYGVHPVRAALANPRRSVHRGILTERAAETIGRSLLAHVRHEIVSSQAVAGTLPPGAVHQGVALLCAPLPPYDLRDLTAIRSDLRRVRWYVAAHVTRDPHVVLMNV